LIKDSYFTKNAYRLRHNQGLETFIHQTKKMTLKSHALKEKEASSALKITLSGIKLATKILHTPCPEEEGSLIKDCEHLLRGKCTFLDGYKCFQRD